MNASFRLAIISFLSAGPIPASVSNLLEVDYPALVSRSDLHFNGPAARSEEGLPIGNGRMGTLVWTEPSALKLQINRVDVFANNCASESFPERHTDYCGGCGFVDIHLGDDEAFAGKGMTRHLACNMGLATFESEGVTIRTLAWSELDVIAVEVTDRRAKPAAVSVNLRMLRPALVKTGSHVARSNLETRDRRIVLTQAFTEGDYYCCSAVAIRVIGRAAEARRENDNELRLILPAERGTFTVLIASAASFDRQEDLAASALDQLQEATFEGILESTRKWWRKFWERSFVHLRSEDGVADELERHYTYYLYLMASTSRGKFPTKFNGMLWTTGGDRRQWGGQFWGANQSCLYNNSLLASNHSELLHPMFAMYSGMLDSCRLAARQQWDSQGAFIPETVAFDGLAALPDDIAKEMSALYLLRKPWAERSQRFLEFAESKMPHSSRWNWIQSGHWENGRWVFQERGNGPFGPVTHIFSRGAKVAYQYWLYYAYTQDQSWLRERAYPMLKNVAEFYRTFPNVKKGEDGKYHIHQVNSNESVQGAQDTDEEIASIKGIFPVLIQASELLQVDAAMRPVWQEFLDNVTSLPRSDHPQAQPSRTPNAEPFWIRGLPPVARGAASGRPDGNTMPEWFFDLCTLESDLETISIGNATLGPAGNRGVGVLSKIPLVAAIMGQADAVRTLVPAQFQTADRSGVLANRMDLREGAQTTSAQRLGNASDALHTALCCDLPAGPGQPSVIRVFAAWPKEWEAAFTLLCRGGFLTTAAMKKGEIQFVEIFSQLGGECRLRDPWGKGQARLFRNGMETETLSGTVLKFGTRKDESVIILRPGTIPSQFKQPVPNGSL